MEALIWQTGVKDDGALFAMAASVTEALQEEQIRARALARARPKPAAEPEKRKICPRTLRDRQLACQ
eukprot:1436494-Pyramimonas_sp.AAC.1